MQESEFAQFRNVMAGLAVTYNRELSTPLLDSYWLALKDWTFKDFAAASAQLLKTEEFMPRPSSYHALRKSTEPTAGEVFAQLSQWFVYNPGGYTLRPETPRPIASAVRAIGGPDAYALCPLDKIGFVEKRFVEHYNQITQAHEVRKALPDLRSDDPLLECDDEAEA